MEKEQEREHVEERQRERSSITFSSSLQTSEYNSTMAASINLPFPLMIICLVLIGGHSSLPTVSEVKETMKSLSPHGSSARTPFQGTEDYSQYEVESVASTVPPDWGTLERCDYNPCLEISCAQLSVSKNCSCPGFTPHTEAPEAPILKSVSWNGSEVVVRWCAPNSFITAYTVTVGGQERQKFGEHTRTGGVGNIDHISEVCVVAVNDAAKSEGSCMEYQPRDSTLPLKAGLIGGALGFLLLCLLAVLLWRNKQQKKQQANISTHDPAETQ